MALAKVDDHMAYLHWPSQLYPDARHNEAFRLDRFAWERKRKEERKEGQLEERTRGS